MRSHRRSLRCSERPPPTSRRTSNAKKVVKMRPPSASIAKFLLCRHRSRLARNSRRIAASIGIGCALLPLCRTREFWPLKNMDRTHPSLHFHGLSRHGPPPDVPRIPKPNSFAARFRDAPSGCPATRAPFDAAIRTKLAARTKRAVQIVTEPTIERPYLPPCGPLHIFGRKVRHQCAACALTGGRLVPVGAITGSDIAAGGGRIADVEARCVSIRARRGRPQGGG